MNNFFKSLDTQTVPKIGQSRLSCNVIALSNVARLEFVKFLRNAHSLAQRFIIHICIFLSSYLPIYICMNIVPLKERTNVMRAASRHLKLYLILSLVSVDRLSTHKPLMAWDCLSLIFGTSTKSVLLIPYSVTR